MPAKTINPFDDPENIHCDDEVEFFTETEVKKLFVGIVVGLIDHKKFYEIVPIDGRENEFPDIKPKRLVCVTRGFIVRKLNPIN